MRYDIMLREYIMEVFIPKGVEYPGEWKLQMLRIPEENKDFIKQYRHFHKAKISKEQLRILESEIQKKETKTKGSIYKLKITMEGIQLLQEILTGMAKAAEAHDLFHEDQELIETWTSDAGKLIDLPDFNVGLLRKADRLKKLLRM